jgi:hypothetical protein
MKRFLVAVALGLAFGATPVVRGGAIAHLVLDSQPGDFVGGGKHSDVTYTPANTAGAGGIFSAQILTGLDVAGQPAFLRFAFSFPITVSPDEFSQLDFATNQLNIPIAPGTYLNAERASFASPGHPGLDVSFEHRGSNTLTGNFTINSLSFFTDSTNTLQISTLDVNFEQHSEGLPPALFGHFTYNAGIASIPEPSSWVLSGIAGVLSVGYWRRRLGRTSAR